MINNPKSKNIILQKLAEKQIKSFDLVDELMELELENKKLLKHIYRQNNKGNKNE